MAGAKSFPLTPNHPSTDSVRYTRIVIEMDILSKWLIWKCASWSFSSKAGSRNRPHSRIFALDNWEHKSGSSWLWRKIVSASYQFRCTPEQRSLQKVVPDAVQLNLCCYFDLVCFFNICISVNLFPMYMSINQIIKMNAWLIELHQSVIKTNVLLHE